MKKLLLSFLLGAIAVADVSAQSAIYACGHIRRSRTTAITKLRNSGYTTAIIFNINVEVDGSLTTDFSWDSQTAAEAGGIICRDGKYTFGTYQPNYPDDVRRLLMSPSTISRLEFCIGGWGNGSYGNIRKLIERDGTGENTILYRNFAALKEAIPQVAVINNDQEQDYDVASAVAFHKMLNKIGYKTTIAPYMNLNYWRDLVSQLNANEKICEIVYLQTYGGGANNNPKDWDVFGDIPMYVGFDNESNWNRSSMESQFQSWKANSKACGGFVWNYNNENHNLNEWAAAINRIFPTVVADEPVATFYEDIDYGGYAVALPEGEFRQTDLALYGIKSGDVTSFKVNEGYSVELYSGSSFRGAIGEWTESVPWIGATANDRTNSIIIKRIESDGVEQVEADVESAPRYYNLQGHEVGPDFRGLCIKVEGSRATKIHR